MKEMGWIYYCVASPLICLRHTWFQFQFITCSSCTMYKNKSTRGLLIRGFVWSHVWMVSWCHSDEGGPHRELHVKQEATGQAKPARPNGILGSVEYDPFLLSLIRSILFLPKVKSLFQVLPKAFWPALLCTSTLVLYYNVSLTFLLFTSFPKPVLSKHSIVEERIKHVLCMRRICQSNQIPSDTVLPVSSTLQLRNPLLPETEVSGIKGSSIPRRLVTYLRKIVSTRQHSLVIVLTQQDISIVLPVQVTLNPTISISQVR